MDSVALPSVLILIWDIKRSIEAQSAPNRGLEAFTMRNLQDSFAIYVADWFARQQKTGLTGNQVFSEPTPGKRLSWAITSEVKKLSIYQEQAVQLLNKSLTGISIYQSLCDLEKEVIAICDDDIEKHIQTLPLLLQIPLLGLIFPAIMMILVVPILNMLTF